MNTPRLQHLLPMLLLTLWPSLCAQATETPAPLSLEKLVIALKPDKDPDKMLQERQRLALALSQRLGKPVEVLVPLSAAVIQEGFSNGTLDLAYLSATEAALASDQGVASVLLVGEIDGHTHYASYWITLKEKPYTSIESLRGKPIAFSSRTSTSGFLIPVWDLHKKGLLHAQEGPEGFFGKGHVFYGVGYVSAAERVLSGEAEAAAVSYYVLDEDRHLKPEQRARLRMMASQGPVPTHTVCVRQTLSEADKNVLKAALLTLGQEDPQLQRAIFTSPLVETEAQQHLLPIREALDLVKNMRF